MCLFRTMTEWIHTPSTDHGVGDAMIRTIGSANDACVIGHDHVPPGCNLYSTQIPTFLIGAKAAGPEARLVV